MNAVPCSLFVGWLNGIYTSNEHIDYAWSGYDEATKLVSSFCKGIYYMPGADNMKTGHKIAEFPSKYVSLMLDVCTKP